MNNPTASSLRTLLRICWGSFDANGNWRPNPFIELSFERQREDNIEAGFMTEDGKRVSQLVVDCEYY